LEKHFPFENPFL